MSNGDDESAEDADEVTVESLETRLEESEAAIEAAETEADLDDVEADIDTIAEDLEGADLPEAEDEDEEDPTEALESRLEEVREQLEEARGPYAEDVADAIAESRSKVEEGEWTEQGEGEVVVVVETFLEDSAEHVEHGASAGDDPDAAAESLGTVNEAVTDAGLDADEDAETIAGLLEATDALAAGLEAAQEWDDLTVVQQMDAQGFYDRLTPENRKDYPPELSVVRIAEAENDPERVLMALEKFTSKFMEENCIDALRRMGSPEAYEPMAQRAQKRDFAAISVLGKIGDERALDIVLDYIEGEANPPLQKVVLRAVGEIGSEEATQHVADRLVAEDDEVRSLAARALGMIGDTRAIDPLADVLADDDNDSVRASAAWALNQIGTRSALEAAAEYAGDRAYLVQVEAERADEALATEAAA
jgi:HEAT repeat protein